MSFIGSGELEHKVTQLQRQLDHKDHELNSIKNEQRKREEELSAVKRAKEDAEYRLRDEADRAHKADSAVNSKLAEISQLKLKLSNMESSLAQTTDKLRKEEKEKERIQDALDAALSSSSDGAARQVRDLQSRTKQLEDALKASEQEKDRLRSQGSSGDSWNSSEPLTRGERNRLMVLQNQVESLRAENDKLKASSASPDGASSSTSPSRSRTKRRSMSMSGPSSASEMIELENQVDILREQLASRKRDLDKAVNEKLAVELQAKKKAEKLQSDLEEVQEELDYYRSSGGAGDSKELEKVKKAMQAEKEQLASKLRDKEVEIAEKAKQVESLQGEADRTRELESQLAKDQAARRQAETSTPTVKSEDSSAKVAALEAEVARLQVQLSSSSTGTAKSADGDLRSLRRELQKALRDKDFLDASLKEQDDLLAAKDDEIDRLRTAIPIPGSPTLSASRPRNDGRLDELMREKATLQDQMEVQKERYEEQINALEVKVKEVAAKLEEIGASEQALRTERDEGKSALEDLTTAHGRVTAELNQLTADLASKDLQIGQLEQDLSALRQAFESATTNAERDLAGATSSLADAKQIRTELESAIQALTQEKEAALAEVATLKSSLETLTARAESAERAVSEGQAGSAEAQRGLSEQVDELRIDLAAIQMNLDHKTAELAEAVTAQEEVQNRFEQAVQDTIQLQNTVNALQAAEGDRSTASESRIQDEQFFALQEEKRGLDEQLAAAKSSYEQELASLVFKSEQDMKEAQNTIVDLNAKVVELEAAFQKVASRSKTVSNEDDIRRLEHKIGQLRTERDELRHNISFVQNERHFAIRALASEKEVAQEEAGRLRDELKSRVTLYGKLEVEVQAARSALAEAQAASEDMANPAEQDRLSGRISELEGEIMVHLETVNRTETRLRQQEEAVQAAETAAKAAEMRAEGLQNELREMVHHMGRTAKLSDPPSRQRPEEHAAVEGEDADLPSDLKALASERPKRPSMGHARSRSSVSAATVQNLMLEQQMAARLKRRDERIAELTHEVKTLRMNETLAKEAQEETMEEIAELMEERDRLETQLGEQQMSSALLGQQVDSETLRSWVLSLVLYRQSAKASVARGAVANELLSQAKSTVERLRTAVTSSEQQLANDKDSIARLEEEKAANEAQLAEARRQELSLRSELAEITGNMEGLRAKLAGVEIDQQSTGDAAVSSLEAQIAEKQDRIVELDSKNASLTTQLAVFEKELLEARAQNDTEVSTLLEKVGELQIQVQNGVERVRALDTERQELLKDLGAAEQALQDGLGEASAERVSLEARLNRDQIKLAQLETQLVEYEAKLEKAQAKTEKLEADLAEAVVKHAEAFDNAGSSEATIVGLRQDLLKSEQARQGQYEDIDRLQQQLSETQASASELQAARDAVQDELQIVRTTSTAGEERLRGVKAELAEVTAELEKTKQLSSSTERLIEQLRAEVTQAQEAGKAADATIGSLKAEVESVSKELETARDSLGLAKTKVDEAVREASEKQAQLDTMREENLNLQTKLEQVQSQASVSPSGVDDTVVSDLKERIEELELSLSHKNEEVDEADDRTREAFKANAKLEKKIGKLQRQLEAAQVAHNTALNKALAATPVAAPATAPVSSVMPPPAALPRGPSTQPAVTANATAAQQASIKPRVVSAPASTGFSFATPTQSARTPLSSVNNIFAAPPSSGQKRHREADDAEIIKPTEAIMLPPAPSPVAPSPRRALGPKSHFTPQRNAFAPIRKMNVFAGSGMAGTPGSTEKGSTVDIAKQRPAFPLPPTRNVFQPTSK
ncbi:hypothetical protein IAU60_004784 [Kwoniella sp. DSM 27419]